MQSIVALNPLSPCFNPWSSRIMSVCQDAWGAVGIGVTILSAVLLRTGRTSTVSEWEKFYFFIHCLSQLRSSIINTGTSIG